MTEKEFEFIQFAHQFNNPWFMAAFAVLAVWSIIWKGIALWKAAKNGSKVWYIIMLAANTMGVLEIIYIFYFSKKETKQNN